MDMETPSRDSSDKTVSLARGLGWFGVALAMQAKRRTALRIGVATAGVLGATTLVIAARRAARDRPLPKPITRTITINRAPIDVYAHWRNLDMLPEVMDYVESIVQLDDRRSRWTAKLPIGVVSWEAEIVEDIPGELIAWRSTSGIDIRGIVLFRAAPGGRGTEVIVSMQVDTAGRFGAALAKRLAAPEIAGDLRRFKQVLETGELTRSDASIHKGRPHAAQPSKGNEP